MGFSESNVRECDYAKQERIKKSESEGFDVNFSEREFGKYRSVKDKIGKQNRNKKQELCKNTKNNIVLLKEIGGIPENYKPKKSIFSKEKNIILEEKISINEIEKRSILHNKEYFNAYSKFIIYLPRSGESLWSIVEDIYGYETDTEIANKIIEIVKINKISNKEIIQKGEKIIFPVSDTSGVIERLDEIENNKIEKIGINKRNKELQEIKESRIEESDKSLNNKPMFTFKIPETLLYKYDGKLKPNTKVIFDQVSEKGEELKIGDYIDEDLNTRDIMLEKNNNIVEMKLKRPWYQKDISMEVNNFDELKEVMKRLLKKYKDLEKK